MNVRAKLVRTTTLIARLFSRLNFETLTHPDYPIAPQRFPFFYGWVIVIVCTIGVMMSIPGQTMGMSVFTDSLIQVTGISRLQLSNAYFVGTLTSGLLLPLGGRLLDRFGARAIACGASLVLAATLCYLSLSDRIIRLIQHWVPASNATGVALVVLGLGFISLRFSGQGMLTMASQTTMGKWFDRRRGFVSGLSGIFFSFAFSVAPLLFSLLIDVFSWRGAWWLLASLVGGGMGAIAWIFYRDNPEICGLEMDGRLPPSDQQRLPQKNTKPELQDVPSLAPAQDVAAPALKRAHRSHRDFSRPEALVTLAFWAIALALSSHALTMTGITFHIVDIGAAVGISRTQIVSIFFPIGVFATLMGYVIGLISDRARLQLVFVGMMVFESLGIAAMANVQSGWGRGFAIVGLGLSGGCFGTLSTVTLPRYFGRMHLGAIAGMQMMSMVIASAIGPSLLAIFKNALGSYHLGLYVCAALPLTLIIPLLKMQNPQDKMQNPQNK